VVYLDRYRKEQGISLPLGLLTLLNSCGEDINMAKLLIGNQLNKLQIHHAQTIVGVGLTYSYLAAVVFGNANPDPDVFDGAVIPKSKLQTIASDLDKGITEPYLPYLLEKNYLPILRLNILFNISLLDKFGLSEIIVCSDGISVGYARQKTQKGR
jgi:exopolyphosphatase/pppGpp-phosphohydrolase